MPPDLIGKQLLPMNPPLLEDIPPCLDMPYLMSTQPLPEPLVKPLVSIPWNLYQHQYLSMEQFIEYVMQNPVSCPLDDQDSPMSDMLPLEPEPAMHYLPDSQEGHMHTLSSDKSPTEPWQQWLDCLESPVSCKHSLLPSSPSSVPIKQCTSQEGSYHSKCHRYHHP